MFCTKCTIVLLVTVIRIIFAGNDDDTTTEYRTVETAYGSVRGKLATTIVGNRQIYEFLGIPYAKPPIESLRFKVS